MTCFKTNRGLSAALPHPRFRAAGSQACPGIARYRNGLINTPARPETVLAGSGTGGGVQRSYNGGLQWNVHPVLDTTVTTGAVEKIGTVQVD